MADLDIDIRLDCLFGRRRHVSPPRIAAPVDLSKPAIGTCRVCDSDVRRPRWVFCSETCSLVIHGPASALSSMGRVQRDLVRSQELAAHIELRGREHAPTLLDPDGRARVPTALRAKIDGLTRWVANARAAC